MRGQSKLGEIGSARSSIVNHANGAQRRRTPLIIEFLLQFPSLALYRVTRSFASHANNFVFGETVPTILPPVVSAVNRNAGIPHGVDCNNAVYRESSLMLHGPKMGTLRLCA